MAAKTTDVSAILENASQYDSVIELYQDLIQQAEERLSEALSSISITTSVCGGCSILCFDKNHHLLHTFEIDVPEHLELFYTEYEQFIQFGDVSFPESWEGEMPILENTMQSESQKMDEEDFPMAFDDGDDFPVEFQASEPFDPDLDANHF